MATALAEPPVEVIPPSTALAAKTGRGGHVDPAALARVAAELVGLADEYLETAATDLALLKALLSAAALAAGRGEAPIQPFSRIRDTAHDMRGVGGTFGYPLVSHIADSLHGLLTRHPSDAELAAVTAHVDALRAVIAARVGGDGGEVGRELLAELTQIAGR